MTPSAGAPRVHDYGPPRLTVELTDQCNLQCAYCLRDEDALHRKPATFLPVDLFARVAREAVATMGIQQVAFTGGEPALHPGFGRLLGVVADLSLTCSFVTNGWHFDRVWPHVVAHRRAITHVSFSLDGATREAHDRWRGRGSFDRVVRSFARCWAGQVPFAVKVVVRKDTAAAVESIALLVARLGAQALSFAHLMPTSAGAADGLTLSLDERAAVEREIAALAQVLRMPVRLDVGYHFTDPAAPCSPLAGTSANVDYRGRLTLCCNLSGFRGATREADVAGDLTQEPFAAAFARARRIAARQVERRALALGACQRDGRPVDLQTGSPCLFCLAALGKTPWRGEGGGVAQGRQAHTNEDGHA